MRFRYRLVLVSLGALLAQTPTAAQNRELPGTRVLTTAHSDEIRVDGVLDEADWGLVPVATDFVLFRPTEGGPPSQHTEARVLFNDDAIFVGATLYDSEPARIRRVLTRRDDTDGADVFLVGFDSYNDKKTAYLFFVTAAGVQGDAIFTNNDDDETWDAVWNSAVRITPDGWVVEMSIPLSQLRFTEGGTTWGLEFQRQIRRTGEEAFWAPVTSDEAQSGIVQLFGRLEGLSGITPRRPIQVAPYTLAQANTSEHTDRNGVTHAAYNGEIGGDIRVGLASNVTLDATINPDFGQVEADPAELNLSTFETFFEERRPFFLEGTQIFDFTYGSGDGALLYTRRVGGSAPIIGASKVSGRLANGLSFGVLGATTGHEFNPQTGYGAVRLKQEFGRQNYLGAAFTGYMFSPEGSASEGVRTVAGGTDWDMRVLDSRWKFEGSLAGSIRTVDDIGGGTDLTRRGYALYVGMDQVRGFFTPGSGFRVYSPDFEINDVGRFRQTNLIQGRLGGNQVWNKSNPFGPFLRFETGGFVDQTWSYDDGTYRGGGFNLFTGGQLRNFWFVNAFAHVEGVGGFDIRETRGLGPIRNIRNGGVQLNADTDERKRLAVFPGAQVRFSEDGGRAVGGSLGARWNASDRVELSAQTSYDVSDDWTAWAANEGFVRTSSGLFIGTEAATPDDLSEADLFDLGVDEATADLLLAGVPEYDAAPGVPGATGYYLPVFGSRDTRNFAVSTRANIIFHPKLSLQLYSQLFTARGTYDDFAILANPDELRAVDYPKRRDFGFESFQANVVLRWEYRPGSALFVVWTQSRNLSQAESLLLDGGLGQSPYDRTTADQLRDTFGVFPNNVFLVKLNYLILR